ncbi:DUF3588 domain containing protein [Trichuris trichiura]|uniref:DUF3588 domain containing protein n=1 Tax=Trichuris trichiura TaxID=36087 RepID=A0A077Z2E1_TRITR|nr:DUF3588 domain containing protein [Trichuris trichiura]
MATGAFTGLQQQLNSCEGKSRSLVYLLIFKSFQAVVLVKQRLRSRTVMSDEAKSNEAVKCDWNWEDFASGLGLSSVPRHALQHILALQSDDRRSALVQLDEVTKEPVSWWPAIVLRSDGANALILPYLSTEPYSVFVVDGFSSVILRSQAWCKFTKIPLGRKIGSFDFSDHLLSELEDQKKPSDGTSWSSSQPEDGVAFRSRMFVPCEFFEPKRYVAVESPVEPGNFWPAQILRFVHGRLLLQPVGCLPANAFWLSCFSRRIIPASAINEMSAEYGWQYKCACSLFPVHNSSMRLQCMCSRWMNTKDSILVENAVRNSVPSKPFEVCMQLERHGLKSGYYLEVLHPVDRDAFYPAEVVNVLNNYYFVVQLFTDTVLDNQPPNTQRFKLHRRSTGFAPMGWCAKNHIRLGKEGKFNWTFFERRRHVKNCRSTFFDNTVESRPWRAGHYVEVAVGTGAVDEFALGIVIRVSPPFVWVQSDYFGPQRHRIFDMNDCTDLYPCGWSAAVDAPLNVYQKIPSPLKPPDCSLVTVYVNVGCSLGPHLCRTVLQKYPSVLGPGPAAKVLGYLFKIILASVHRPAPLCRAFYASFSQFCPSNKVLPIKANYANGQRLVELVVCDDARHVPNFLYHISVLLGACCSTFSLSELGSAGCPLKCTDKSGLRHTGLHGDCSGCPSCSAETRRALPVVKRQPKNKRRILFSKQGGPSRKKDKPTTLDAIAMTVEEVQREVAAAPQGPGAGPEGNVLAGRNPSIPEGQLSRMRASARQTQSVAPVVIATAVPVVPTLEKTEVKPPVVAVNGTVAPRFISEPSHVLNFTLPPVESNPLNWSHVELCTWLARIQGFGRTIVPIALKYHLNGESFMICNVDELAASLPLGDALKALEIARFLRDTFMAYMLLHLSGKELCTENSIRPPSYRGSADFSSYSFTLKSVATGKETEISVVRPLLAIALLILLPQNSRKLQLKHVHRLGLGTSISSNKHLLFSKEMRQEQCRRSLEALNDKQVEDQCSIGYSSAPSTTYSVGSERTEDHSISDAEFYDLDSVHCLKVVDDEGFFGEDDDDTFLSAKVVLWDSLDIDDVKPSPDFWACRNGSVQEVNEQTNKRSTGKAFFSLGRQLRTPVRSFHVLARVGKPEEEHIYEEIPDDLPCCSEAARKAELPPPLPPRHFHHPINDPEKVCMQVHFCGPNQPDLISRLLFFVLKTVNFEIKVVQEEVKSVDVIWDECVFMVDEMTTILRDPTYQKDIQGAIKNLCRMIPQIRSECENAIDSYTPAIFENLLDYLANPTPFCQKVGMCKGVIAAFVPMTDLLPAKGYGVQMDERKNTNSTCPFENIKTSSGLPAGCVFCKYGLSEIVDLMSTDTALSAIEGNVLGVCSIFPADWSDQCTDFMLMYFIATMKTVLANFDAKRTDTFVRYGYFQKSGQCGQSGDATDCFSQRRQTNEAP